MSTPTIAFVRSVTAASTAAESRFSVRGSTSAKTGTPPSYMKQLADAANEYGDLIRRADPLGDRLLEAVDRRAEREPPGPQHLEHELRFSLAEVRPRQRDRLHLLPRAGGAAVSPAGANSSHWLQRSLRPCTVSRYACWISCVTGPG